MRAILRVIAILAAASFLVTVWEVMGLVRIGELGIMLRTLLEVGIVGWLTAIGWLITLVTGPIAAVQLWRLRATGRIAGLALFGFGAVYDCLGALLREPEAPLGPIVASLIFFVIPLALLVSPRSKAVLGN